MLTKKALFEILDKGNFTYVELFVAHEGVNASSLRVRETGALTGESTSVFHKFRSETGAHEKFDLVQGWVYEWNNTHKPVEHKETAGVSGWVDKMEIPENDGVINIGGLVSSDEIPDEVHNLPKEGGKIGHIYNVEPEGIKSGNYFKSIQCPTVVKENGDELIAMQFTAMDNIKQIFETPDGEQYVNLINSARRDCSKKSIEKRVLREIKRQMHHYGCYDSLKNPYWGKTNKNEWARDVMRNLVVSQSQNIAFEFVKNRVFHYFGGWEYNLYQEIQKFYHAHVESFDQIGYNLFWNSTDEAIFDLVDGEFDALFQH